MIERRGLVRHKTFMTGRIYFNNRLSSMDCIIRDMTDKGARLEFSENVTLPEAFELYIPNKDEYYAAHVKWRRGDSLGITWRPEYAPVTRDEEGRVEFPIADRVTKLEHDVAELQRRLDVLRQN